MEHSPITLWGWILFAVFGLGAAGCSGVDEVTIADLSFKTFDVLAIPNVGRDSVRLDVMLVFKRQEDDPCFELSPGVRGSVDDQALTTLWAGGIIRSHDWRFPDVCSDGMRFELLDVPLSTVPTDTTIRVEDDSGSVEMTISNLLVKRQVSFIEPADGVLRPNEQVRLRWTPDSDAVDSFGVSFLSPSVELHAVDNTETHDFWNGMVRFQTQLVFTDTDTQTSFEPGTMLKGLLRVKVPLTPKVIACGVEGRCTTSFQAAPTTPADLLQE